MTIIKEAILGFAISNNRLPCPDINFDGNEDVTSIKLDNIPANGQTTQNFSCAYEEGLIPYLSLGASQGDTWFNYIGYRVSASFNNWSKVWRGEVDSGVLIEGKFFSLSSVGNIKVNSRGDNPSTTGVIETKFIAPIITNAAAVVISYGRNVYGAFNRADTSLNDAPPSTNADETTNATKGVVKVSRVHTDKLGDCSDTDESKGFCEFDDIVDWISPNILFNRLV